MKSIVATLVFGLVCVAGFSQIEKGTATVRLKDGSTHLNWDSLVEIRDGNHRVAAYKKVGRKKIKAIMPQSHYEIWRSC